MKHLKDLFLLMNLNKLQNEDELRLNVLLILLSLYSDRYKHTEFLLVTTRNEEWMKNLIPMIHEDSSLIAVGATHLIGINGLIAKLRNLGYNVDPMR